MLSWTKQNLVWFEKKEEKSLIKYHSSILSDF